MISLIILLSTALYQSMIHSVLLQVPEQSIVLVVYYAVELVSYTSLAFLIRQGFIGRA